MIVIKRHLIVALLWLAYIFLLAHSVIPHHHNHHHHVAQDLSAEPRHHHPSHGAHDNNGHDDAPSPLEHYSHSGPTVEFQNHSTKVDCALLATAFIISFLELQISTEDQSPPDWRAEGNFRLPSESAFTCKGLRAPPVA